MGGVYRGVMRRLVSLCDALVFFGGSALMPATYLEGALLMKATRSLCTLQFRTFGQVNHVRCPINALMQEFMSGVIRLSRVVYGVRHYTYPCCSLQQYLHPISPRRLQSRSTPIMSGIL